MFSGRYEYTIDDKGRLSIPSRFRDILASHNEPAKRGTDLKLILTNLEGCVTAYPEKEWEGLLGRLEKSPVPKEAKNFLRFFFASASECPIDKLGRILIPQSLRNYGAIKKNVVVIGMNKKIEIWAESAWAEVVKQATSDMDKIADIASVLGL